MLCIPIYYILSTIYPSYGVAGVVEAVSETTEVMMTGSTVVSLVVVAVTVGAVVSAGGVVGAVVVAVVSAGGVVSEV